MGGIEVRPLRARLRVAGLNSERCDSSSLSTPHDWAVVKERMESAVRPLVREAKQHFSAEAVPMLLDERMRRPSVWIRSGGRREVVLGPEMTREGFFQVDVPLASGLSDGGPPIMPPSRKWMGIGSWRVSERQESDRDSRRGTDCLRSPLRIFSIVMAVRGEIAFRSMYVKAGA